MNTQSTEIQRYFFTREGEGPRGSSGIESLPDRMVWLTSLLAAGCGTIVITGWLLDIAVLKSVIPGLATMKFNTALCFALSGMALQASRRVGRYEWARTVLAVASIAVLIFSAATLVENCFPVNLGIDTLFVPDPLSLAAHKAPGRMSLATSASFVLLGAGICTLLGNSKAIRLSGQWSALFSAMIGLLALEGYVFGVKSLYRVLPFSSMALHTALLFVGTSVGLLCARPREGLVVDLLAAESGGSMARNVLPAIVVIPTLIGGGIHMWLMRSGYDREFEAATGMTLTIVLLGLVTWFNAKRVNAASVVLKMQQAKLERSNQDLEQFAYAVSHDLKEPLRAVSGCVQLLQARYSSKLDARADEFIGHSVDGCKRMQALIDDLLTYSKVARSGDEPDRVNCNEAVNAALANLSALLEESQATVKTGELPEVRGEQGQLVMVFQNLINNAVKFRRADTAPTVEITASRNGSECEFVVRDDGIGIAPEHFERIFGVFQRLHTRREYPGTGIGLALCKRIVERHGGRIWLESTPGRGTSFHFTVPGVENTQ